MHLGARDEATWKLLRFASTALKSCFYEEETSKEERIEANYITTFKIL